MWNVTYKYKYIKLYFQAPACPRPPVALASPSAPTWLSSLPSSPLRCLCPVAPPRAPLLPAPAFSLGAGCVVVSVHRLRFVWDCDFLVVVIRLLPVPPLLLLPRCRLLPAPAPLSAVGPFLLPVEAARPWRPCRPPGAGPRPLSRPPSGPVSRRAHASRSLLSLLSYEAPSQGGGGGEWRQGSG